MDQSCLETIRTVVPDDSKVFFFSEFAREFAPSLALDQANLSPQILDVIIAPLDTCPVLKHIRTPKCCEPAHTLVDDVVWRLVQLQQKLSREQSKKGCSESVKIRPNVLTNGFVVAREGELPPAGMRPGIARAHNRAVTSTRLVTGLLAFTT